jgi:two-component system KDP operon response regulator KdpE
MSLPSQPAAPPAPEPKPSHPNRILVIDDEPHILLALQRALAGLGAQVDVAATAAGGMSLAAAQPPDLVILDLGLPDREGLEVCRELRRHTQVPIVVLSARQSEHDKVALLDAGADDYITKPFSTLELAARVQAQLRRAQTAATVKTAPTVSAHGLVIDFAKRNVRRGERDLHLTPIEWRILQTLVAQAGRTLTHQQIFDAVWGDQAGNPQQYLRVHLTNLRRKVERDPARPKLIITEPGVGYRVEFGE